MNFNEAARKLHAVAFALNKVEVKGRDNMDALLGSIQTVEQIAGQLEFYIQQLQVQPKEEPEVKVKVVPDNEEPVE